MNRLLLTTIAALSLAISAPVHAQSAAPRMIAPPPVARSPIPGLRLDSSITPASLPFDARYAPSAMSTNAPRGSNGFPAPTVPVRIVLRMQNTTSQAIYVGDASGDYPGWQLTLSGPGAVSIESQSPCRLLEIARVPRMIEVPAGGSVEIALTGLASSGSNCPASAWFWTAPGHYVVRGTLRTNYAIGARPSDSTSGTVAIIDVPPLAIDVR